MTDFRKARGQRYSLACYLSIMLAARLAGYWDVAAFGEFAGRLSQDQVQSVGGLDSPSKQRHTAPAMSTFHYIMAHYPPDIPDRTLSAWSCSWISR